MKNSLPSKKELIGNILMKQLIEIRTDTLWRMLFLLEHDQLPGVNEEGATGKMDNKGAIFIPGGLIYQDVDEKEILYEPETGLDEALFRKKIIESMQYDNATLLFPDGLVNSVNLDGGFFTRAARRIFTYKAAAFKRKKRIGKKIPVDIDSCDIIRSHSPTYIEPPYGSRTRISTCVSIGLSVPYMYFAYCKMEFGLSEQRLIDFTTKLDAAQEPAVIKRGLALYPPYVVVCHDTRYKKNSLTGLIKIMGMGKFGEFSTFTLEKLNNQLLSELKRKKMEYGPEHVFAEYNNTKVIGILRTYRQTNPGKRSQKYRLDLVSPEKDVGLNLSEIEEQARKRYQRK